MTDIAEKTVKTLRHSYGNKWGGDADKDRTWSDGLKAFDAKELGYALNEARALYPDWPPTLMQFRQLCFAMRRGEEEGTDEAIMGKWSKWCNYEGIEPRKHGEQLEQFRRRIVDTYYRRMMKMNEAQWRDYGRFMRSKYGESQA